MTREELKTATTEKLISALEYCGRDSYYATYYDEVVNEITKRLKQNEEMQEEIKDLEWQLQEVAKDNDNYQKENKALRGELVKKSDTNHILVEQMAIMQEKIDTMKELLNRYYQVCAEIPKEYRTMVFDSCMEDTRQLSNKEWLRI